ncbi:unnamed protein product [Pleuronectes platessa]|uniref:Uncharacterized protein n=1 Tax=Pleuronectes platessa TaxID=8262 RepID=A0A9N7YE63_PLEPL|nr:unnamed protein product [Pleuronectes platessa]
MEQLLSHGESPLGVPEVSQRGKHHLDLKPDQWTLPEELEKVLKPFEQATVFLGGEAYVTVSALRPLHLTLVSTRGQFLSSESKSNFRLLDFRPNKVRRDSISRQVLRRMGFKKEVWAQTPRSSHGGDSGLEEEGGEVQRNELLMYFGERSIARDKSPFQWRKENSGHMETHGLREIEEIGGVRGRGRGREKVRRREKRREGGREK